MNVIKECIIFILLIFLPNFMQLIIGPYYNKYVYTSYIILLGTTFIVFVSKAVMNVTFKKIVLINIVFILLMLYQMLNFKDFSPLQWMTIVPYWVGIQILVIFSERETDQKIYLIEKAIKYVLICFYFQFLLSVYESVRGSFLVGSYDFWLVANSQNSFKTRFIFNLPEVVHPFTYLKFGLSGLLGQHNAWALQLPFYNLIFAFAYVKTAKRSFLYALIFVFIAILTNTTRTGIFAVIVTDILVYMKYFYKKKIIINLGVSAMVVFCAFKFSGYLYDYCYLYFSRTDNLSIRYAMYSSALHYLIETPLTFFTGLGVADSSQFVQQILNLEGYNARLSGYENGFFDVIFAYGAMGLGLFIYLLKVIAYGNRDYAYSFFNLLLFLNIMLIGMTLGHVFHLHVYPYVLLCFISFYFMPIEKGPKTILGIKK